MAGGTHHPSSLDLERSAVDVNAAAGPGPQWLTSTASESFDLELARGALTGALPLPLGLARARAAAQVAPSIVLRRKKRIIGFNQTSADAQEAAETLKLEARRASQERLRRDRSVRLFGSAEEKIAVV